MYTTLGILILWAGPATDATGINVTGLTITVCDCNKPETKGVLDLSNPKYCSETANYKAKPSIVTQYDIITRKEPSVSFEGWMGLQWQKTRQVSCWFGGSCTIEHLIDAQTVCSEECWSFKERMTMKNVMTMKCNRMNQEKDGRSTRRQQAKVDGYRLSIIPSQIAPLPN